MSYNLTIVTETFSRTDSGKSWRIKPDTMETETFPWEHTPDTCGRAGIDVHKNLTGPDTLQWYRRLGGSEYVTRGYREVGYVVSRLVSTSPDRETRKVRRFYWTRTA